MNQEETSDKEVTVCAEVPPKVYRALTEEARRRGVTLGELAATLLAQGVTGAGGL